VNKERRRDDDSKSPSRSTKRQKLGEGAENTAAVDIGGGDDNSQRNIIDQERSEVIPPLPLADADQIPEVQQDVAME